MNDVTCTACGSIFPRQHPMSRRKYCGVCLCECGTGIVARNGMCLRCGHRQWVALRLTNVRKPSLEFSAIQREAWIDKVGRQPYWTRERVIRVLQNEYQKTGVAPGQGSWARGRPGHVPMMGDVRHDHPNADTVCRLFGSWNAGLRVAGLPTRVPGENKKNNPKRAPIKKKDKCSNGHAYTPENTYYIPDGSGRVCRQCRASWARRSRAAQREAGGKR